MQSQSNGDLFAPSYLASLKKLFVEAGLLFSDGSVESFTNVGADEERAV